VFTQSLNRLDVGRLCSSAPASRKRNLAEGRHEDTGQESPPPPDEFEAFKTLVEEASA
jgi:hypothetical protein